MKNLLCSTPDITEVFCQIDDFCHLFEMEINKVSEKYTDKLVKKSNAGRPQQLPTSEVMVICFMYHFSGYRTFKDYYCRHVITHLRNEFPQLVSYSRIVELQSKVVFHNLFFAMCLCENNACTGISIIDSFAISVCHNKRISSNRVFKGLAQRGKTSMGWFFGFKLHVVINPHGEIVNFTITPGNTSDANHDVIDSITKGIWGKLLADKGYIGLFKRLYERGIHLIHGIRSNMKNILMPLFDKLLSRKRGTIETVGGIMKSQLSLVHHRHRSPINWFSHIFSTITAYCFWENKPTILQDPIEPCTGQPY